MNDTQKTIQALNKMLAHEHTCAIRYATHAAVVSGPYAETVAARLKEISNDEIRHAELLRERIIALGGEPTMGICEADMIHAQDLHTILDINLKEEQEALKMYLEILETTPQSNVILYQTLQEIIRDEQEHLEELENFKEHAHSTAHQHKKDSSSE